MVECVKEADIAELRTRQESFDMAIQDIKKDIRGIHDDQRQILSKVEAALKTKADKEEVDEIKMIMMRASGFLIITLVTIVGYLLVTTLF